MELDASPAREVHAHIDAPNAVPLLLDRDGTNRRGQNVDGGRLRGHFKFRREFRRGLPRGIVEIDLVPVRILQRRIDVFAAEIAKGPVSARADEARANLPRRIGNDARLGPVRRDNIGLRHHDRRERTVVVGGVFPENAPSGAEPERDNVLALFEERRDVVRYVARAIFMVGDVRREDGVFIDLLAVDENVAIPATRDEKLRFRGRRFEFKRLTEPRRVEEPRLRIASRRLRDVRFAVRKIARPDPLRGPFRLIEKPRRPARDV